VKPTRIWGPVGAIVATAVVFTAVSLGIGSTPASAADIRSCEFGTGQAFDVQWSLAGSTLSVASMAYPFSNYGLFYPNAPATRFDAATLATSDYFQFFDSTTVPGTLGLELFDSGGTLQGVIDDTGSFQALGSGFIFYVGDGNWGTLFATQEGFHYGDSATFTATNTSPTTADALAFTSCATAPVTLPVIGSGSPPAGTVATTYPAFAVPVNSSSGFTYAITSGSLPAGLGLDPTTGTIAGTPTASGDSTFTITVTGGTGSASVVYAISVSASSAALPTLPVTGVDDRAPASMALVAILMGATFLVVRRRRRSPLV
jgi:LPXTG-motif cell wall-anchored protein